MKYGPLTGPHRLRARSRLLVPVFGKEQQGKGNARGVDKSRGSFFMLFPSHAVAQAAISRGGSAPAAL